MEQREHSRIKIPLLVELTHPAIGTVRTTARDISAGGLFVRLQDPQIKVGGKLKLRLLTILPTDTQTTPTVEMEIKRTTVEGLGLMFINRTAEHLWSSVRRLRNELEIGRDYFQVHQSLALTHPEKGLLVVQQNGKWLLPGHYLQVGENAAAAMRTFAEDLLGLSLPAKMQVCAADSSPDISVVEAATYSVIFHAVSDAPAVQLAEGAEYKDWRWLGKIRDLQEITFASDLHRTEAKQILKRVATPSTID